LRSGGAGLPVLCLDLGATAELVPDGAGFKIPPTSRERIVAGIADACAWVAHHRDEAAAMGRAARNHALERHDWKQVRAEIEAVYRQVAERGERSDANAGSPAP
jgi:glycosyltransferase involved in cell wall biosynthesis